MSSSEGSIRLAIEGCGHGTLHSIYASVEESCRRKNWPGVDLLIIGGDFQAVRNASDLHCVSMPAKYRAMCDFHEYYSGARTAPYLTLFVGGNHEASNYLLELYYGGWVAPNIYYVGAANVLRLGTLRIAGMSGIWKGHDYRKPHLERLPFSEADLRSVYHVRELDVRKLLQVRTPVDVGISHDWPQGIEWKGNWRQLFKWKKHFEADAKSGRLGSVAAKQVLDWLRPKYWFSAHLHVKYAAVVEHANESAASNGTLWTGEVEGAGNVANDDEIELDESDDNSAAPLVRDAAPAGNPNEIDLNMEESDDEARPAETSARATNNVESRSVLEAARAALPDSFNRPPPQETPVNPGAVNNTRTEFLSLDKCLANRDFLQLMSIDVGLPTDINHMRPLRLSYDREWLAITRAFTLYEPPAFGDPNAQVSRAKAHSEYTELIHEQFAWIDQNIQDFHIPENFEKVAPVYDGGDIRDPKYNPSGGLLHEYPNPQTARFCEMLQMPNPLTISEEELAARMTAGPSEGSNGGHWQNFGRGGRGRGRGRGDRGGGRRFGAGRGRRGGH